MAFNNDYERIQNRSARFQQKYYADRGLQKKYNLSDQQLALRDYAEKHQLDANFLSDQQIRDANVEYMQGKYIFQESSNVYSQYLYENFDDDGNVIEQAKKLEEETQGFWAGIGEEILEMTPLFWTTKENKTKLKRKFNKLKEDGVMSVWDYMELGLEGALGYVAGALTFGDAADDAGKAIVRGLTGLVGMAGSVFTEVHEMRVNGARDAITYAETTPEFMDDYNRYTVLSNKRNLTKEERKEKNELLKKYSTYGERGNKFQEYSNALNFNKKNNFGLKIIGEALKTLGATMDNLETLNNEYTKAFKNGEIQYDEWGNVGPLHFDKSLKDPRYWINQVPVVIGQVAGLIGLTVLTPGIPEEYAVAGYVIDYLPINVMFSASEADQVRTEAEALGYTEDEAHDMAGKTFRQNFAVQAVLGQGPGAVSKLATKTKAFNTMINGAWYQRVAARVSTVGLEVLFEGVEEVLQDEIRNNQLDPDHKWLAEMSGETFVLGAIGGLFGGAHSLISTEVQRRTYNNLANDESTADALNTYYDEAIAEGKTESEAKAQAYEKVFDVVDGTEFAEKIEAMEKKEIQKDIIQKLVKPVADMQNQKPEMEKARTKATDLESRETSVQGFDFKFDENNGDRVMTAPDQSSQVDDETAIRAYTAEKLLAKYPNIKYDQKTNTYRSPERMAKFAKELNRKSDSLIDLNNKLKAVDTKMDAQGIRTTLNKNDLSMNDVHDLHDMQSLTDNQYIDALRSLKEKARDVNIQRKMELGERLNNMVDNMEDVSKAEYNKLKADITKEFDSTLNHGLKKLTEMGAITANDAATFRNHEKVLKKEAEESAVKQLEKNKEQEVKRKEKQAIKDKETSDKAKQLEKENAELKKQVKPKPPQKVKTVEEIQSDNTIGLSPEQAIIQKLKDKTNKKVQEELSNQYVPNTDPNITADERFTIEYVDEKLLKGRGPTKGIDKMVKYYILKDNTKEEYNDGHRILYSTMEQLTKEKAKLVKKHNAEQKAKPKKEVVVQPKVEPYETTIQEVKNSISETDIDKKAIASANRWSTTDSDSRAEAEVKDYVKGMNEYLEDLSSKVTNQKQADILKSEFARFKEGYLKKYNAWVSAKSRTANPMVTGPAKFNYANNDKANDIAHKRLTELMEYEEKGIKAIEKKIEDGLDDNTKALRDNKKAVDDTNSFLASLKGNGSKELFKANFYGRMVTVANHGEVAKLQAVFDTLNANDTVFTKRHKIWKLMDQAIKVNENKNTKQGSKVLAEYEGVQVVNDYAAERIQLKFDEKPNEMLIKELKSSGFRWSPKNEAWQRKNTNNGLYAAKKFSEKHFTASQQNTEVEPVVKEKPVKPLIEVKSEKISQKIFKDARRNKGINYWGNINLSGRNLAESLAHIHRNMSSVKESYANQGKTLADKSKELGYMEVKGLQMYENEDYIFALEPLHNGEYRQAIIYPKNENYVTPEVVPTVKIMKENKVRFIYGDEDVKVINAVKRSQITDKKEIRAMIQRTSIDKFKQAFENSAVETGKIDYDGTEFFEIGDYLVGTKKDLDGKYTAKVYSRHSVEPIVKQTKESPTVRKLKEKGISNKGMALNYGKGETQKGLYGVVYYFNDTSISNPNATLDATNYVDFEQLNMVVPKNIDEAQNISNLVEAQFKLDRTLVGDLFTDDNTKSRIKVLSRIRSIHDKLIDNNMIENIEYDRHDTATNYETIFTEKEIQWINDVKEEMTLEDYEDLNFHQTGIFDFISSYDTIIDSAVALGYSANKIKPLIKDRYGNIFENLDYEGVDFRQIQKEYYKDDFKKAIGVKQKYQSIVFEDAARANMIKGNDIQKEISKEKAENDNVKKLLKKVC